VSSKALRNPSGQILLLVLYIIGNTLLLIPAQQMLSAEGRDIRQDYLAARRLAAQQELYSLFTVEELDSIQVDPNLGMTSNFHPPTSLLLFYPFALFPFREAVFLWSFVSIAAFFLGIFLLAKELDLPGLFVLSGLAFAWFPFWLHVRFGQFSTLIFFFLVIFWINARRGREGIAGVFLGIAILAKLFPALLVLWGFLHRQWRLLLSTALTCLLFVAPLFAWSPEGMIDYLEVSEQNSRIFRPFYGNFSLNGFWGKLFIGSREVSPLYRSEGLFMVFMSLSALLFVLLAGIYISRVKDPDLQISIMIVMMLLLSPTTWAHNWTILVLPGAILLSKLKDSPLGSLYHGVFAGAFLLSCFPHWQFLEWVKTIFAAPLPAVFAFTSPGFYVLVGLFILIWRAGMKRDNVRAGKIMGVLAAEQPEHPG
jgi:hypothetical protein